MPHAHEEPPLGLDEYIAALAAEEETIDAAEEESFEEQHDADVIQLKVRCSLCGYRCSPRTWDGFLARCANCGAGRGRISR